MEPLATSELLPHAEACLDYLDREHAHLGEVRDSLNELTHALRQADTRLLELVRLRQQVLAERTEQLSRTREDLIARIATATGLAEEEIHLSRVESLFPAPWSYRIHEKRLAILVLGGEIQTITLRNNRLARYCRDFVNGFVSSTTTGVTPSVRYGRSGTPVVGNFPLYLCQG